MPEQLVKSLLSVLSAHTTVAGLGRFLSVLTTCQELTDVQSNHWYFRPYSLLKCFRCARLFATILCSGHNSETTVQTLARTVSHPANIAQPI